MAKERLSKATGVTFGYGQVEPNHLSAQRTGQIYAQLPATGITVENGQFVKYDLANGAVNLSGSGEWMLAFSEVKVYADYETDQDFVIAENAYPRVFKTNVGDIFTTNCTAVAIDSLAEKATLAPNAQGILAASGEDSEMVWQVVAKTTMPDGQAAVKVIRIK